MDTELYPYERFYVLFAPALRTLYVGLVYIMRYLCDLVQLEAP